MLHRRTPCFASIRPPADFEERYLEGIGSVGPEISVFPFGARCTYVASATGETVTSEVGVSNGVCKGWVSLRKETHCWLSTRRRVKSVARLRRRALSA